MRAEDSDYASGDRFLAWRPSALELCESAEDPDSRLKGGYRKPAAHARVWSNPANLSAGSAYGSPMSAKQDKTLREALIKSCKVQVDLQAR